MSSGGKLDWRCSRSKSDRKAIFSCEYHTSPENHGRLDGLWRGKFGISWNHLRSAGRIRGYPLLNLFGYRAADCFLLAYLNHEEEAVLMLWPNGQCELGTPLLPSVNVAHPSPCPLQPQVRVATLRSKMKALIVVGDDPITWRWTKSSRDAIDKNLSVVGQ